MSGPGQFAAYFRVDVRLNAKVVEVRAAEREVSYVDSDGARRRLTYERLILATGTVPIVPPIAGLDGENLFHCRTVPDADSIVKRIEAVAFVRGIRAISSSASCRSVRRAVEGVCVALVPCWYHTAANGGSAR